MPPAPGRRNTGAESDDGSTVMTVDSVSTSPPSAPTSTKVNSCVPTWLLSGVQTNSPPEPVRPTRAVRSSPASSGPSKRKVKVSLPPPRTRRGMRSVSFTATVWGEMGSREAPAPSAQEMAARAATSSEIR